MTSVFERISEIEKAKWSFVDYTAIFAFLRIETTRYKEMTEYQNDYTTYNFTTPNHTDVGPEGLLANCHNFFLVAIPSTAIGFFILKGVFKLTFNCRISLLFRKFAFFACLLLMLFDGNIQQFAFYMGSEW